MKRATRKALAEYSTSGQNDLIEPRPFPLGRVFSDAMAQCEDELQAQAMMATAAPPTDRALGLYLIETMWPRMLHLVKLWADDICAMTEREQRNRTLESLGTDLRERVKAEVLRRFTERRARRADAKDDQGSAGAA